MIEQLELKLAEALTERAELEDVVIPEARFFVSGREASSSDTMKHTMKHRSWTRSSGFAIAAAAVLVIAGLAVLSLRSARSGLISTIDNDPAIATNPVTLTSVPASTSSAEADSGQELSEANQPTIETQEISLDYLAALPGPNPTLSPPSLDWVQIETPEGSEGFRTVSYVGDDYFLNAYDALWILDQDQESERVPNWVQLDVPTDHVIKQILNGSAGRYQVITIGPIPGNPRMLIWQVSSDLRLVDPVLVSPVNPYEFQPLSPPRMSTGDDFLTWTGVNFPQFESLNGQLVVANSFTSDVDLEALMVDRGIILPNERICDLEFGGTELGDTWIRTSVGPDELTDTTCRSSTGLRIEVHTAETLGIPEEQMRLILGAGEEHRTVVSLVDGSGDLRRLLEVPGITSDLFGTGDSLLFSTWDETGQWRVLQSSSTDLSQPWQEFLVPGQVVLSTTDDASFYVIGYDEPASVFRLGDPLTERRLGSLPDPWQLFTVEEVRSGPGGIALPVISGQRPLAVLVSDGQGPWTSVDVGQDCGLYWGQPAVGHFSVMIAATDQAGGSLSIYLADFPAS